MSNKQVIVFPRGQLTAKDKAELTKNGFLAIEADEPSRVVTVLPGAPLATADDMLMAAFWGLLESNAAKQKFVETLFNRMKRRDTNPPPPPPPPEKP